MFPQVSIFCVLKSSAVYGVDYVAKLYEQCKVYAPGTRFACISNVAVPCERIPMTKGWPGWWSKMELFRPEFKGDILFIDLDTIITGSLEELLAVNKLTMLSDFYFPDRPASGLMYLPESYRNIVWSEFMKNSSGYMRKYRVGGDQKFIGEIYGNHVHRWQDLLPGKVISYKAHKVPKDGIPEDVSVVCHHGRPKNRDINWQYPNMRYDNGSWVREA